MKKRLLNHLIFILSLIGLLIGVIALISPIPIGIIIIALSLSSLIYVSPKSQKVIQHYRHKSPRFNTKLQTLESKLEHRFTFLWRAFIKTRPHIAPHSTKIKR